MKFLKIHNNKNITTITINNEKNLNALNSVILDELDNALSKIESDKIEPPLFQERASLLFGFLCI